ncbi:MAG: peptide deformylase [Patescibacteria group bacterium]|nr:peptide deformylase [Patescibacteria group bacterium]
MLNNILIIDNKKEHKFLREKTADFDFKKYDRKQITALLSNMRRIMREANGIGLSANQIGLNLNMFVAEVPDGDGGNKFYAVFNPKIEKRSEELTEAEEGCLSVPGKWGEVARSERLTLSGFDKNGKAIKIKAWGLLARVFQHETDHLNGKLFLDRAKKVFEAEKEK